MLGKSPLRQKLQLNFDNSNLGTSQQFGDGLAQQYVQQAIAAVEPEVVEHPSRQGMIPKDYSSMLVAGGLGLAAMNNSQEATSPFSANAMANRYVGNSIPVVPDNSNSVIVDNRPTTGSRANRNFNPFNITGMSGKKLYGAVGLDHDDRPVDPGDKVQQVYANDDEGLHAGYSLSSGKSYNDKNEPIRTAFSKYQSDQKAFADKLSLAKERGVNINKSFNQQSPEGKAAWLNVTTQWEGYKGKQITPEMVKEWDSRRTM